MRKIHVVSSILIPACWPFSCSGDKALCILRDVFFPLQICLCSILILADTLGPAMLQTLYRKHFTVKCGITATKNLKNVYRQTYFFNEVAYLFELVNILPSFVVF